ncbi:vexin [Hoplias malabaricus]|uniref:vexin n=1 Tax=Hoplias malabaricus TaxID=27720 RepID=UPI0034630DCE
MQNIYMQSNEHFEVFTTVFSPQVGRARHRYRHEVADKVVVTHKYLPQWPDEVELTQGDVILVLSRLEESRWFGRLQSGQQGYFPPSCVLELSQKTQHRDEVAKNGRGLRRHSSVHVRATEFLGDCTGGGRPQAPRGGEEGPFLALKHEASATAPSSPSLLHRILSKHRRRSHCQGASNGAFEPE